VRSSTRAISTVLAVVAVLAGEGGLPLASWLVGMDALAGSAFFGCGIVATGTSRRLFASSAYAGGLMWFLANRAPPLLFSWRPAMVLAVLTVQNRPLSRWQRVLVGLLVVDAAAPSLSNEPWVTLVLTLPLLIALPVQRNNHRPHPELVRSWALFSQVSLAMALAVPAVGVILRSPPSTSENFTLLTSGLVALSGFMLLVGLARQLDTSRLVTDSVIDLSQRGRIDAATLEAMLRKSDYSSRPSGFDTRDAVMAGVQMLEDNRRWHVVLEAQIQEVEASRRRLLDAADTERMHIERRLERQIRPLLDEVGTQLELLLEAGVPAIADDVQRCLSELQETRSDLELLAGGMHPRALVDRGLSAALNELASRSPASVSVVVVPPERLPIAVETAVWYACAECMTNIGKYARCTDAQIVVEQTPSGVGFSVTDNGIGGAIALPGGGLAGLVDRLRAVGGGLDVESDHNGTRVKGWVPCPPL
jgi:signal transduction histidine kinase